MSSYKRRKTPGNTEWFVHDRFGMFIHFGLYALPARHEWVKSREFIPEEKYDAYFRNFNPDLFDAKEWARTAKAAGMKYCVLTAKHHEGFCLFDTKYTDYKITNTPFGRDLVKEYVEAFRAEGLKVGFYYSLLDWHHPDYVIDGRHPLRHDPNGAALDAGRDMKKYAQYMRDQVTELLTNYGKIDILWLDFTPGPRDNAPEWMQNRGAKNKEMWESEKLIATVRSLQPEIIINNRSDLEQDLWTPEQYQPREWIRHAETGELVTWEACQTFSGSWGYYRDEYSWKSPEMLIDMLTTTVSCGGNLIMNVGPTARGYFDHRAVEALEAYGEWMKYNGRSIYGCTMAEPQFKAPEGTVLTQSEDGKRLYIHLQAYPFGTLRMNGLGKDQIDYICFLSDGSEIGYKSRLMFDGLNIEETGKESILLNLPTIPPKGLRPVIEIILK